MFKPGDKVIWLTTDGKRGGMAVLLVLWRVPYTPDGPVRRWDVRSSNPYIGSLPETRMRLPTRLEALLYA